MLVILSTKFGINIFNYVKDIGQSKLDGQTPDKKSNPQVSHVCHAHSGDTKITIIVRAIELYFFSKH